MVGSKTFADPFMHLVAPVFWNTATLQQETFVDTPGQSGYSYLWDIDITLQFAVLTTQGFLQVQITWGRLQNLVGGGA